MKKQKGDIYIDICVIPPLKETIDGFGDPSGPFARYSEMYVGQVDMLSEVKKNPVGFLLGLMDDAGVDVAVLTAEDAQSTMGMITPNEKVADNFIPAYTDITIPPPESGWNIKMNLLPGRNRSKEALIAIATRDNIPFSAKNKTMKQGLYWMNDGLELMNQWLLRIGAKQRTSSGAGYMIVK